MAKLKSGRLRGDRAHGLMARHHLAASSSTYNGGRTGYGPARRAAWRCPGPNCYRCPIQHCRDKLRHDLPRRRLRPLRQPAVGAPAAVIVEPIQSSAGIIVPPEGYFSEAKELVRGARPAPHPRRGADRARPAGQQLRLRAGRVAPDILTLSKTLGNGVPMAATSPATRSSRTASTSKFLFYTSHLSDPMPARSGSPCCASSQDREPRRAGQDDGRLLHGGLARLAAALRVHRRHPRPRPPDRPRDRQGPGEPDRPIGRSPPRCSSVAWSSGSSCMPCARTGRARYGSRRRSP